MEFTTDYRLEDFILDTQWEDIPIEVRDRVRLCFIDLMGALIAGSRSKQFETGLRLAKTAFCGGDVAVVGSREKFSFLGSAAVMGHASNAYDIDDGHNITRTHPGTSFIGGLLAAAYKMDTSLEELLTSVTVAYEATIRMSVAGIDFYKFMHSSGTFGAFGTAVGVGRLFGFDRVRLNNLLSVAEFNAPIIPASRSVEYPSMNKDGVPFGVMAGALAVLETINGFTGNKNLLELVEYRHLLDSLGDRYELMELYFKPYPCCRWSHAAIDACLSLLRTQPISFEDIHHVTIKTFEPAIRLSKIVPRNTDEAQYNIAYPVAAAIVNGEMGVEQVMDENLGNPVVLDMMKRLFFQVDEEIDAQFPEKRKSQAIFLLKDGTLLLSDTLEAAGGTNAERNIDWISNKFRRITKHIFSAKAQEWLLGEITSGNGNVKDIIDRLNEPDNWI